MPILCSAQAHLGDSYSSLQSRYPDIELQIEFTDEGRPYTMIDHLLGTFIYYFDSETYLTDLCVQVPNDMQDLNTQIEIYNNKYVVLSETTWKAYLEGGGKMNIELIYNEEYETYLFYYTY